MKVRCDGTFGQDCGSGRGEKWVPTGFGFILRFYLLNKWDDGVALILNGKREAGEQVHKGRSVAQV